jgi:hypothetical protein
MSTTKGPMLPSLIEDDPVAQAAKGGSGPSSRGGVSTKIPPQTLKVVIAVVAILAAAIISYVNIFGGENSQARSWQRVMIDSETRELFPDFPLKFGDTMPFTNPKTGKRTLYQAEMCYWTKDGKAQFPGIPVLLNEYLGKTEPTTCPDCGRRVTFNNPPPPAALLDEARNQNKGK